ncbi:IclR family transcriptional regulator [Variovorax paradoxus]|jgi:DNA-binding IclR family transcriptional regulator|uniref:IclR family transcriptional regulator n=1 Tax=Variovorax TaxID=34072 RepID=UPI0006E52535|nr:MULTISPECIES: IclR family transcriptional regulator [unclassified Variovorax]KPU97037.1 IclR family transcriptional regulator [Variovorax paradoxus]KPV05195.1 IclR family transcriptional regulator [Variovorax paradoxus]KPV05336.1 IclR family transcriptional regulator [Variovorax paradoxus]KPV20242.1 IclR family transcriptional regulator [Variovorax paradoxus]KPV30781.1 IclR family transcriptional regulator [Variovorax paradoxus]
MNEAQPDADRAQRGIQSIEVGGQLLRALVHHGRPMALKDLAREADMTPAKAHPYMVSFGRLGLIEQDRASGHYLLGPLALQLGLISLQQADPVHIATPAIAQLAQQTGHTIALAVWGARGATIVRTAESPSPVHVNMRHGTVFSLTNTASGRVFAAYLDAERVRELLEAERLRQKQRKAEPAPPAGMPPVQPLPSWADFERQLQEVRAHGISRSDGEVIEGVSAMAAPVFDHTGAIVLAITAIGPAGIFDTTWDGAIGTALKGCADAVSQRLGASRR